MGESLCKGEGQEASGTESQWYWRDGKYSVLTVAVLDKYEALLSPPCQPYTRQGLQKDSGDARAFSFLNILELIPKLSSPPLMLFVENETSDTHKQMVEMLKKTSFTTQEFILSRLQFGVPYSRPRYFCLPHFNNQLLWNPSPLSDNDDNTWTNGDDESHEGWENGFICANQSRTFWNSIFLLIDWIVWNHSCAGNQVLLPGIVKVSKCDGYPFQILLTISDISFFIVSPSLSLSGHFRYCLFLFKTMLLFHKKLGPPEKKGKPSPLSEQGLRYFTPREVSNLHSFPENFHFPEHISLKQRYALLGNSLSIAVVGSLLGYLFSKPS
ncbi:hypothetical protein C5167_012532 [Papaver somniferum]|uniref:Uncharacterized protein n=1 Tax=Papaver somniferum TaxID=3469 RepID=A0A4Y7IYJ3_PAPSO|nr:hypothetical protein C5167_012532 [Papaver somniferum]